MTITSASIANALKVFYGRRNKLSEIIFNNKNRKLMAMLPKDPSWAGKSIPFPVLYEDAVGGRSATFSDAQTNASSIEVGEFLVTVAENHQVVKITTKALLEMRNDTGSFLKQQFARVTTAINNLSNNIENDLWGNGSGSLGTVASLTSTTITLNETRDAKRFGKNMVLEFSDTETGTLLTGNLTVDKVDFTTGIITTTTDPTAITGLSANDHIFQKGDGQAGGAVKKVVGLKGWLTGSTTLFGQDRSDHSRLQGVQKTISGSNLRKGIYDTATDVHDFSSGDPNVAFMSNASFALLAEEMDAKLERPAGPSAEAGFTFITINGPTGPIKCMGCTFAPEKTVAILTLDTWTLGSLGPLVRINADDGSMAQRQASASGIEIRADSHAQLACSAPSKNGYATWT